MTTIRSRKTGVYDVTPFESEGAGPDTFDRRASQKEMIRQVLSEVMQEQRGFKKNGSTFPQWLERVITPERAMLLIVLIFQVGSRWTKISDEAAAQSHRTTVLEEQHKKINDQLATIVAIQKRQDDLLSYHTEQLQEQVGKSDALLNRSGVISNNMKLSITRGEFNSAMQQQILPQLRAINERLRQAGM